MSNSKNKAAPPPSPHRCWFLKRNCKGSKCAAFYLPRKRDTKQLSSCDLTLTNGIVSLFNPSARTER